MRSYIAKIDNEQSWWVIDAKDMVLGRLASEIAKILRGKHKASFTPFIDTGDHVVVVNAEKIKLTGKKLQQKTYYRHTGHPGGIKETNPEKLLSGRFPERLLEKAVERMMPKESPLATNQLKKLRVYAGEQHPHEAQQPKALDIAGRNRKNIRKARG